MKLFGKKKGTARKRKKVRVKDPRQREMRNKLIGGMLLMFTIFTVLASVSYLFSWRADQSLLDSTVSDFVFDMSSDPPANIMGKLGAAIAHLFIYKGLGLGAFLIYPILFLWGFNIYFNNSYRIRAKTVSKFIVTSLWVSLFCSVFFYKSFPLLSGMMGYGVFMFSRSLLGYAGVIMVLLFISLLFLYVAFGIDVLASLRIKRLSQRNKEELYTDEEVGHEDTLFDQNGIDLEEPSPFSDEPDNADEDDWDLEDDEDDEGMEDGIRLITRTDEEPEPDAQEETERGEDAGKGAGPDLTIEKAETKDDAHLDSDGKEHYGIDQPFDPRLDLRDYVFPEEGFLVEYGDSSKAEVTKEELEKSKRMIVETLENYKIGIDSIKATIGPTVTLFEIVPEKGVRIGRIKGLEDDIALSLAALGIRIIAPIPGKGTIGIEVPNVKPEIVSMHSMIASNKFKNSKYDLPVCLGKTIDNEIFIADLAKMPHLLMAGATGQGKSVGLNAIIVSLLYKKHPAELKFVMVDPKKVELTLYRTIERHYLAKLPGEADAVITDNKQVISTLNSLVAEMDARYDLLQSAFVRNIKEYNKKFISRKLNPEEGHRYLPYIVLIIDELADLMMTAGKEVEHPIGRLAQLARAIGIHLILATQRPSVNIITGTIKANFPARIAFRVTSKIDSRTILDGNGADQLIGKGDMLFSNGTDLVRLQCPFVDTPEVDEITAFIGNQRGYPDAHLLPEVRDEDAGGGAGSLDDEERDALFEDAARIVVQHQQGSTSLIQRRLKVGYNRAGRLIDQLEAAGVVGPFEGSKARSVLYPDEYALEQFLNNMDE